MNGAVVVDSINPKFWLAHGSAPKKIRSSLCPCMRLCTYICSDSLLVHEGHGSPCMYDGRITVLFIGYSQDEKGKV